MNDTTIALLFAVATVTSMSGLNKLILNRPALAAYAVFQVTVGSLLVYLGFHPYLIF